MRCPNCQTLNPSNAKFCLECGNRLLVCPNCGTVNLPIAKFCIECGTTLQPQTAKTALTPPAEPAATDHTGDTQPLPALLVPPEERRVVTVMFADITGSTPLADRLDPEDMRAILSGYFNLMTEQIRKHGGTVEKYIGDAVMAVFGIPVAHEDDPDRAIRAALDMQAALNRFNEQRLAQDAEATRLQMRIGINTGEVAAPVKAGEQRQDFLITGDAVNIAARLQQVAAPDTILVGERTYLSARDVFDFRAIAPLRVKGKPEPIEARVVLGLRQPTPTIAQHPRGIVGHHAPLVGRSLELTLLHANYARVVAEHRPHLITILGTPGIGKSRLVNEFISREQEQLKSASATGTPATPKVLKGRCPPYGEGITYWPLIEILRALLDAREDESSDQLEVRFQSFVKDLLARTKRSESPEEIVAGVLRRIGRNLTDATGSSSSYKEPQLSTRNTNVKQSGTQVALLRAWRVLLEALAEEQPLIIVVDDLQWADEALLEFLEYLTDRITTVPILFLCPARPDFFERRRDWGGGKRNFTTIELETLSREESSELVDALLNADDLPEVLRNTILTRAEGNPFFVEEIVRMFIDQGILIYEENAERNEVCWHIGPYFERLSELSTIGERPEDSLLNIHYLLPLPRIPDTVQGVLAARVDLLNPAEKFVLQNAAIMGRTFWLSTLLELAGDLDKNTVMETLKTLCERDFVVEIGKQVRSPVEPDSAFIFKHILIRDVVYNNIPRLRRSQAHARLALWLEKQVGGQQDSFIELLAYHYQQALATWPSGLALNTLEIGGSSDHQFAPKRLTRPELRQRAITYLTLAGDHALNSYYTVRAIQAYNDALELLNEGEADVRTLSTMYIKLGDAHSQRGSVDEAWQEYRKALRLLQDGHVTVEEMELLTLYERLALLATRWLGHFNTDPDAQEIRTYIDAGLRILDNKPMSRERVAFLTYQAFWYIRQLETATYARKAELVEQALACGHEALGFAEELNDPSLLSLVLDAISFIYCEYHQYNEAHQFQHRRQKLESMLTVREELYDLYISLGAIHLQIADFPNAMMWFGRAWTYAQTMESPTLLLLCLTKRLRTWQEWNRWEEARQVALEILSLVEQYQQGEKQQLWALETLAKIAYRTGNLEEGEQYTRQFKKLIEQQAERLGVESESFLAMRMHAIHLAREEWDQATTSYLEKLRASEPLPSPEVLSTLAELLVTTGEHAEMQAEICERAVRLGEESGARKSLAIACRARGRMYTERQQWQQAEEDLRRSLALLIDLDLPWERGNTIYQLGMLYKARAAHYGIDEEAKRSSDLGRARYNFEQALGFFESLKALPSARRVRLAIMQDSAAPV